MQRAILLRSPSCPSFLGISIISAVEYTVQTVVLFPAAVLLSSFFFRALEALESGGVKRGRMTVNQDALSPGLRGVYFNETTRTPYYQN